MFTAQLPKELPVVSLIAFIITAQGMNPYLVASFNSGFACENTRAQIIAAALEQNGPPSSLSPSHYALEPRHLKCISTPGLVAGGSRPPEPAAAPRSSARRTPAKRAVK
jgi:hypothetical protein